MANIDDIDDWLAFTVFGDDFEVEFSPSTKLWRHRRKVMSSAVPIYEDIPPWPWVEGRPITGPHSPTKYCG